MSPEEAVRKFFGCYTNGRPQLTQRHQVDVAAPDTEVTVLCGEEPNSAKPAVERHHQVEIRATVGPRAVRPGSPRLLPHVLTSPGRSPGSTSGGIHRADGLP
jgi:hypothetical protein